MDIDEIERLVAAQTRRTIDLIASGREDKAREVFEKYYPSYHAHIRDGSLRLGATLLFDLAEYLHNAPARTDGRLTLADLAERQAELEADVAEGEAAP